MVTKRQTVMVSCGHVLISSFLQAAAAQEPVGSLLMDWTLVGQLVQLASQPEEGTVCSAGRGRPVLDGLLGLHQVGSFRNKAIWSRKPKYLKALRPLTSTLLAETAS